MSDTPRTDAEYERLHQIYQNAERINGPLCCSFENDMRLCRQLERELNAANQEIERLSGVIETMGKGTIESQWRMVKEAAEMESKHRVAMDRVKLLERLGDNMAEYMVDGREVDDWKDANRERWKRRENMSNQGGKHE